MSNDVVDYGHPRVVLKCTDTWHVDLLRQRVESRARYVQEKGVNRLVDYRQGFTQKIVKCDVAGPERVFRNLTSILPIRIVGKIAEHEGDHIGIRTQNWVGQPSEGSVHTKFGDRHQSVLQRPRSDERRVLGTEFRAQVLTIDTRHSIRIPVRAHRYASSSV